MKLSHTAAQVLSLILPLGLAVYAISPSRNEECWPRHPFRPLPPSNDRLRTCHVRSNGDGTDDSSHIMSALFLCNNGGKVVFDADKTYTIGKALDMTFLRHVDLGKICSILSIIPYTQTPRILKIRAVVLIWG